MMKVQGLMSSFIFCISIHIISVVIYPNNLNFIDSYFPSFSALTDQHPVAISFPDFVFSADDAANFPALLFRLGL